MKYQLTNDNIQCFSSVADLIKKKFEGEKREQLDKVIFKINNAESVDEGYEVELSKEELELLEELFAKASENEEIKKSTRFKDLKKAFSIAEKTK